MPKRTATKIQPPARRDALSQVLDRVIRRNLELTREVAQLKRRCRQLERKCRATVTTRS